MPPPRSKNLIGCKGRTRMKEKLRVSGGITRFSSPGSFAAGLLVGGPCSVNTPSAGRCRCSGDLQTSVTLPILLGMDWLCFQREGTSLQTVL